jgi:glycosyltransferase involved in cell wall biosynthesis
VVRSDSFAGVERYVALVAPRLAARGCEVTVIGGDQSRMCKFSDVVRWRSATTAGAVAAQIARLGRLDIIHAHMTAAEVAAVLMKPRHRAQLVATLHFATPRGAEGTRTALRPVGWALNEQIAISNFVAASVPASRVLQNGVECADPGPTIRDRTVLVMQRLEAEKHTEVAIRAWAESGLRRDGWRLVIAGRGSKFSELERMAAELDLAGSVEWAGFVDDPTHLLSKTGILLAPAPAEPFGLTVVEAMARATPVLAADGGAHRETVGPAGWLFPVGDARACARLLDTLPNRDLADYGSYLHSRQQELFNIDTHVDELVRIYRELIG